LGIIFKGFFTVLALLFFLGPASADEAGLIAALCARPDLQALREAQEEITVRDLAAASGIKESKVRQLVKANGQGGAWLNCDQNSSARLVGTSDWRIEQN
jgi:hypothetical protein